MPNLSLTIGQLKITPLFWSLLVAAFLSSFSIWRKLKEDLKEEEIFSLTLLVSTACLLFSWLLIFLVEDKRWLTFNFFLFFCFWGGVTMIKVWVTRLKKNVWEVFDSFILPFLYFLFFAGLGTFFKNGNFRDLGYCLVGLFGYLLYVFSRKRYRSFNWYKSGKIGFLFWETALGVFLLMVLLAFSRRTGLYWEELILVSTVLVCLGVLYYRSERNLLEDLKKDLKRKKSPSSAKVTEGEER